MMLNLMRFAAKISQGNWDISNRNINLVIKHNPKIIQFKDLPKEAKLAIRAYHSDSDVMPSSKHLFGYVILPIRELKQSIFNDSEIHESYKSFDEYHKWYIKENIPKHTNFKWPVILSPFEYETLQDGWHRFHRYVMADVKNVPAIFYIKDSK